jgi:hypothetical protein
MKHGCIDCTHRKRYRSDLLDEGVILEDSVDGVAIEGIGNELAEAWHPFLNLIIINSEFYPKDALQGADANLLLHLLQQPVQQEAPPEGVPCGYVHLSVMDGKSLKHKVSIFIQQKVEMKPTT